MLVDSMKIAYKAFMAFRSLAGDRDAVLGLLIEVLDEADSSGVLAVESPDETAKRFPWLSECEVATSEGGIEEPPEDVRRLVHFIDVAAHEFQRLSEAELDAASRSLGYAMHSVPELITRQQVFDPDSFMFSLAVAAFHWPDLSEDMRNAMAAMVGYETSMIDELVQQDGFVVEMYPSTGGQR